MHFTNVKEIRIFYNIRIFLMQSIIFDWYKAFFHDKRLFMTDPTIGEHLIHVRYG